MQEDHTSKLAEKDQVYKKNVGKLKKTLTQKSQKS